ncbi:acetolactate synthase large subunit [Campylobacter hominis]|uniref:Acetolactate synthase n=1 Tax=Campylobacter hominis (strain ATCC BAA-381 / DSM 21671 / CCUG 45161 / LMG 19568 / NCTC 13146 / CH001A) TaxID=360107 RepID=A7I2H9_CAMHC|nr:acetolactate synthase large subunit [Campylobacter hominis]ABS52456.1 acetolactate synthase, large subunit, biosynthetic type [Campylobacter hominis ATCC BAA-381]UAK86027.1 acetolactate synthase large subunit [Campylobacter hominis]SUW85240.1 acetolactate synthase 3 catalytic subunit [Campylobacter hominis]
MSKLNGSQMIMEALKNEGVEIVFGYPGGAALNIYDEIYKQKYFRHILVRHEQAAVHAADGYARASGKVGVAFVTSGPGFTNAVTGLATAYADSIPVILISAQVSNSLIGSDAFQEIDAVGISRPCVKHNYLVKSIDELPRILKEAFYIAKTGRPGPVHIDIPKDVSSAIGEFEYPDEIKMQTYKPNYKGNSKQIKKAIELIEASKKPLFYLGGGVISSNASEAVRKLIEITQIPAVETLMALGALDSNDPNCLNMVGMHGSYAANMAMSEADLIIALGARFDDRVTGKVSKFAKNAKIIHVDIDPSSISKIINADFPIVGDVKSVVEDMIERAKDEINPKNFNTWHEIIANYSRIHPLTYKDSDEVLKPQWIIEETARNLPNDAIVTTDVGQHQMWVAQYFPFKYPRTFLTSGGLGTMGYSLPASMGAKLAHPTKEVVNFVGDGSVLMNIQELMTMIQSNIKVIHIILNNGFLGMVRQWQSLFYGERFSSTNIELQPDFVKLIESFGGLGFRATNKEEFSSALKTALSSDKVSFIDAHIDRFENVMPMVPAGGVLYNMILE